MTITAEEALEINELKNAIRPLLENRRAFVALEALAELFIAGCMRHGVGRRVAMTEVNETWKRVEAELERVKQ